MNEKHFKILCVLLLAILIALISYAAIKIHIHNQDVHNYFQVTKSKRDEIASHTIKSLNTIIEDPNASPEARNAAVRMVVTYTNNMALEKKIEEKLYPYFKDDVLCFIENVRCRIIAHKSHLSAYKTKRIKSIVYDVAHITEVEFTLKK